ncbi:MAG TPA: glutamate-cysteine ligase family protein [Acidobacteriota bacterium]|nr:glutamate-cysteine ligase family protein [Acidobacteriota bacterium]
MTVDRIPFHLFEVFGVELEYMIVDSDSLDVRPLADKVLYEVAGGYESEVVVGELAWSNELVLHVIELKTNGPARSLNGLATLFHEHTARINTILEPFNACLLPTAMHPWMDPHREMTLWPHGYSVIYETYNRIFDCRGHGWANLQSTHINLPFADNREFGKLHAAIRLLLPLLPALAASSPVMDGRLTGTMDNRMVTYRKNSAIIPSITGSVIPEPVFTSADYDSKIFQRIYADIRPHDPGGIIQHEWLNSRGAIARYMRNTIEIRVLDIQEAPAADLAIVWAIVEVLKQFVAERWIGLEEQMAWSEKPLQAILLDVVEDAESAEINDADYLKAFGFPAKRCTAGQLWAHLVSAIPAGEGQEEFRAPLEVILEQGSLSRRITKAFGNDSSPGRLREVYRAMRDCLERNIAYIPAER